MPFIGYPGVDVEDLQSCVDPRSFDRGQDYFRSSRVIDRTITYDPDRGRLYGKVRGRAMLPYECTVFVDTTNTPGLAFIVSSNCSCPVGIDCKHVVALVLRANAMTITSAASTGFQGQLPWREALRRLDFEAAVPPSQTERVALQFGLRDITTYGWGQTGSSQRLQVRLAKMGKRHKWISCPGGGWDNLHAGRMPDGLSASQSLWIKTFATLLGSVHAYGTWLDLSTWHNPLVFYHLDQAKAAQVELVGTTAEQTVALARSLQVGLKLTSLESQLLISQEVIVNGQTEMAFAPAYLDELGGTGCAALLQTESGWQLWLGPSTQHLPVEAMNAVFPLTVPSDQEEVFWRESYPELARTMPLRSSGDPADLPPVPQPTLVCRLSPGEGFTVWLSWLWRYPEPYMSGPMPEGELDPQAHFRDLAQEAQLSQTVRRILSQIDATADLSSKRLSAYADQALVKFLQQTLPQLERTEGVEVEVCGQLPEIRLSQQAPVIDLKATEAKDGDWFDLGVKVSFEAHDVPFRQLFTALASGDEYLVLDDGFVASLDHPALDRLRQLIEEAAKLSDRSGRPRINRFQADLWGEIEDLADSVEAASQWQSRLEVMRLLRQAKVEPLAVPKTLTATLRPYQHQAYEWLMFLYKYQLGGVLADDMGLGKTVESLAMVAGARQDQPKAPPFLVVAPSSVVSNWAGEAARFVPSLKVGLAARTESKAESTLAQLHGDSDLIVTSYAVFRLDNPAFGALDWSGLILDEAQFAKNHTTKANQQARALKTPFKLAVTGTPMENSLNELWAVFSIVAPGLLGNARQFKQIYADPIAAGDENNQALERLRQRLRPLMLRRNKELVAPELPPRMEQVLQVELEDRHRAVYDTHLQRERQRMLGLLEDFKANRFAVLRSLTLLRRLALDASLVDPKAKTAPSSKLNVLMEQLDDVVGSGHRALVFSQFTTYLTIIAERLGSQGIDYAYLDGSTVNRAKVIDGFKQGTAPVFLISLKAGGFGLNLTEADYVFLMDPWWNPATEAQAVDRTHRIGQDRAVMVFRLVSKDTIEDKVMALKERKAALFDAIMQADGTFSAALSEADVRALLD